MLVFMSQQSSLDTKLCIRMFTVQWIFFFDGMCEWIPYRQSALNNFILDYNISLTPIKWLPHLKQWGSQIMPIWLMFATVNCDSLGNHWQKNAHNIIGWLILSCAHWQLLWFLLKHNLLYLIRCYGQIFILFFSSLTHTYKSCLKYFISKKK